MNTSPSFVPTSRSILLSDHLRKLGIQRLFWNSSKSTDAAALSTLNQELTAFSLIGDFDACPFLGRATSLERLIHRRVNYDVFSFEKLNEDEQRKYCATIVDFVDGTVCGIVPFSSSRVLYNIFCVRPHCRYLANNPSIETFLNYKPYVERLLSDQGIRTIPYSSFLLGLGDKYDIPLSIAEGRVMTRIPTGTGGTGHRLGLLSDLNSTTLPVGDIMSVAPYLLGALSFNVSACRFRSGAVRYHPPSLQIIGDSACSANPFSYCGNEFGRLDDYLTTHHYQILEDIILRTSEILRTVGYIGVFGLDFILHDNNILISELNPRFQASALLASHLLNRAGLSTVHEDHISAQVGLEPTHAAIPISELARIGGSISQIFVYQSGQSDFGLSAIERETTISFDLTYDGNAIEDDALLYRAILPEKVTSCGKALLPEVRAAISAKSKEVVHG